MPEFEWDEDKSSMMEILTVKQAVERVNQGGKLDGVVLDEQTTHQVNVRDAVVLSMGGIVIPEQNLYYNDEEIEYDEDIDELVITSGIVHLSWEEKAERAEAHQQHQEEAAPLLIDVATQKPEIDAWIANNKNKLATLLKPIVVNLFQAEKAIKG